MPHQNNVRKALEKLLVLSTLWLTLWSSHGQCNLMKHSWKLPSRCVSNALNCKRVLGQTQASLKPLPHTKQHHVCAGSSGQAAPALLAHADIAQGGVMNCPGDAFLHLIQSEHTQTNALEAFLLALSQVTLILLLHWNSFHLITIVCVSRPNFFPLFSLQEAWKWDGWKEINWQQFCQQSFLYSVCTCVVAFASRKKIKSIVQTIVEL